MQEAFRHSESSVNLSTLTATTSDIKTSRYPKRGGQKVILTTTGSAVSLQREGFYSREPSTVVKSSTLQELMLA